MSFAPKARCVIPIKAGYRKDIRMPRQARTTSNSINVKPQRDFFFMGGFFKRAPEYRSPQENQSEKEPQKQDCLTRDFASSVCRSCPIQSLLRLRLHRV